MKRTKLRKQCLVRLQKCNLSKHHLSTTFCSYLSIHRISEIFQMKKTCLIRKLTFEILKFYLLVVLYVIIFIKNGGARGVMVTVLGIGHVDTSSNPGRD